MTTRFDTTISRVERCGGDVLVLSLTKPAGYAFRAGQWFRLFLQTDDGEEARTFSHASAPGEPEILLATRLSDSTFKQALGRLGEGDRVEVSAPGGRLALPEGSRRLVFLTGGVGVTPVRSMLAATFATGATFADALVLYGVRDETCVPFLSDLDAMAPEGVRVVVVCERPGSEWTGESGFITAEMVRRHAGDPEGRTFVVTGPPAMVVAMERVLDELDVPPALRVVERFGPAAAAK